MSLIDLIRGKPNTVARIASVAIAPPPSTPTDATKVVASIERIIINSSSATAIGAITATDPAVDITTLPPALIDAAVRVCREIHNDPPEAVAAMLADLAEYPPDSWSWLTDHFQAQLPPSRPTVIPLVQCSGCSHAEPSQHHPAIIHCKAGVASGIPAGGWFDTDRHPCDKWEVR